MKAIPAIFIFSLATLLIACGKDKFETKPRLEIKDYNTKELYQGQELAIRLNYFDKEGDLNGAHIIGIKQRLNILPLSLSDHDLTDTFPNQNNPVSLPEFPAKDNGEIRFQIGWDRLQESLRDDDTVIFRFAVTDRAGNKSDTVNTDRIILRFKR